MEIFHLDIEFPYISYGINKVLYLNLIEDVCCNLIKMGLNQKTSTRYVNIYKCYCNRQMNWLLKFCAFFCILHHQI
jgi:hypothetical protein